jgi:hypothetical protein
MKTIALINIIAADSDGAIQRAGQELVGILETAESQLIEVGIGVAGCAMILALIQVALAAASSSQGGDVVWSAMKGPMLVIAVLGATPTILGWAAGAAADFLTNIFS